MTLREKLAAGQFVVCGEMGPPKSADGNVLRRKVEYFKGVVDAVNITDNQTATVRLSSIAAAKILIEEGLEPIMQMTCRDRNRIGIQSDLLGAAALGIQNVLCLTGDHQKFGDQPEARGVFDLDSVQLVATVDLMNKGQLLSGQSLKVPPHFLIGAAANPFAEPFEMRLIRLYKKVQAGAHFIQTQPVFNLELFSRWMAEAVKMGLHEKTAILAGVMPISSVKSLEYMKTSVPGVKIDESYIERMAAAADPKLEGLAIAVEIAKELKGIAGIRGVHIMPSGWESITPTLVAEAGLRLSSNFDALE